MRRISWHTPLLAAVALAGGIPLACSGASETPFSATSSGGGSSTTTAPGTGGAGGNDCFPSCDGTGGQGDGLLEDHAGGRVHRGPQRLVDAGRFRRGIDGSKVSASWVVDLSSVANVDKDGIVNATGNQGGDVVVKALFEGQTATATVTVNVKKHINPGGIATAGARRLEGRGRRRRGDAVGLPVQRHRVPEGPPRAGADVERQRHRRQVLRALHRASTSTSRSSRRPIRRRASCSTTRAGSSSPRAAKAAR